LAKPEIHDLGLAGAPACRPGDHNVGAFDVPVSDPFLVSRLDRFSHLDRDVQGFPGFDGMSADALPQALPLDEFHRDERTGPFVADFVNGANIGMGQRGGRPSFDHEPLARFRIRRQCLEEKLESHRTLERRVLRLIDDPHPSFSDKLQDPVLAGHQGP
jgi:hypothetical protein